MARDGLLIGEVAARSGVSRKALRLYEAAGILPAPRRTAARYRVYGNDTLAVVGFVTQARRLGFTLEEIKEIVSIKLRRVHAGPRSYRAPPSPPIPRSYDNKNMMILRGTLPVPLAHTAEGAPISYVF